MGAFYYLQISILFNGHIYSFTLLFTPYNVNTYITTIISESSLYNLKHRIIKKCMPYYAHAVAALPSQLTVSNDAQ